MYYVRWSFLFVSRLSLLYLIMFLSKIVVMLFLSTNWGGRVVRCCWCVLLIWIMVGHGPTAFEVDCLVIFLSSIVSIFLSLSLSLSLSLEDCSI